MIKGLFLDDDRIVEDITWINYPENIMWTTVRTHYDFIIAIEKNDFDIVSFDHDIQSYNDNDVEVTGYNLLKWCLDYLYETDRSIPEICIHSQNPIGKANMYKYYSNWIKYHH